MCKENVVVLGSSGLVASELVPRLNDCANVYGVDRIPSLHTKLVSSISDFCLNGFDLVAGGRFSVVHLAAARFDYGALASDYYNENVVETEKFLSQLDPSLIQVFVHVSSVAAFDGADIPYKDSLGCDDAYRSTKFSQEQLVRRWAEQNGVPLYVLYPSAIFSSECRSDTNIGKLQKIARNLPFALELGSTKSLTYLPDFCDFIIKCLKRTALPGRFLAVERPLLTVGQIMSALSGRPILTIYRPFLVFILYCCSFGLWVLSGFGRFDFKLTPNRVKKLLSSTEYYRLPSDVDADQYNSGRPTCFEILRDI